MPAVVVNTTVQTSISAISVTVSSDDGAATLNYLNRTDVNGSRSVRLAENADLSDGLLVVTDSEAALTGTVIYTTSVDVSGTAYTDTDSASFDAYAMSPYLAPAVRPDLGVALTHILVYESMRPTATTVHQVINRKNPLVSVGVQGSRMGTIDLYCADYASARAIETSLGSGETMLLRQQDYAGLDMYFTPLSTELSLESQRWIVRVEYQEIAAPNDPLFGTVGWTIAASSERNPTLADSQAEFPLVSDLLIGPEVI